MHGGVYPGHTSSRFNVVTSSCHPGRSVRREVPVLAQSDLGSMQACPAVEGGHELEPLTVTAAGRAALGAAVDVVKQQAQYSMGSVVWCSACKQLQGVGCF